MVAMINVQGALFFVFYCNKVLHGLKYRLKHCLIIFILTCKCIKGKFISD